MGRDVRSALAAVDDGRAPSRAPGPPDKDVVAEHALDVADLLGRAAVRVDEDAGLARLLQPDSRADDREQAAAANLRAEGCASVSVGSGQRKGGRAHSPAG